MSGELDTPGPSPAVFEVIQDHSLRVCRLTYTNDNILVWVRSAFGPLAFCTYFSFTVARRNAALWKDH